MIILYGNNALSPFKNQRMYDHLRGLAQIKAVRARFIYFVDAETLSSQQMSQLEKLLDEGPYGSSEIEKPHLIVIPRIGTISPWCSKATDIVKSSGIDGVDRVERGIAYELEGSLSKLELEAIKIHLHDPMTESVVENEREASKLFKTENSKKLKKVPVLKQGKKAIEEANIEFGLALNKDEIKYLESRYKELKRDPTDAELTMFAQANSEHCRHKIFNSEWEIDGKKTSTSLFKMIKNTAEKSPGGIRSAYSDNAAVIQGYEGGRFFPDKYGIYKNHNENSAIVIKVETHNHPTAIAPIPGAGTGSGGEIRDEGATGIGAKPKAGLTGFSVSNLNIPGFEQPWEVAHGKPEHTASALRIMTDGPIGGAAFNNEFGRANLNGYFRTYEQKVNSHVLGYHKPIMIAGGVGSIREEHIDKHKITAGSNILVLGGPAMLIGLGGASASSSGTQSGNEDLDFASVQRHNPELQRRAQEVINSCWALGDANPIVSIHDVGAGGLSNALPELVHDSGKGAVFELRNVPNAEAAMSPMEIWSNEAQERYVLAIADKDLDVFKEFCDREYCPYAVLGKATDEEHLTVTDNKFKTNAVDIPLDVIFGKPPKMTRKFKSEKKKLTELNIEADLSEVAERVLRMPSVASKSFLITIGDRTVGGLTVRDQMVGPHQVPVGDAAVMANAYDGYHGEAMAMGERTPIATINAAASARMAVAEAITNIVSARIQKISDIKLSANWMAAADKPGQNQDLYEAVKAVGIDLCPKLGIAIPVGKDSLSMQTNWDEGGKRKSISSPLSVIISAFAPVKDIRLCVTPELKDLGEPTSLIYVDLAKGKMRMGGSAAAQAYKQVGNEAPDVVSPKEIVDFFNSMQALMRSKKILAYHDRSDGGLFTTICEMAFAGKTGVDIDLSEVTIESLFNEELGAVIQVREKDAKKIIDKFSSAKAIGTTSSSDLITFKQKGEVIIEANRAVYQKMWSETSYHIQSLRDNSMCAVQELQRIEDTSDGGLFSDIKHDMSSPKRVTRRPKVAILRERGVNGQVEMAAAFDKAGFESVDVHMSDLYAGRHNLADFKGMAVCGGFSFGDVLGAGAGWAKSILFNKNLRKQFEDFFKREDTFTLGVCNGCQMLSHLKEIIPGAEDWPRFVRNTSEQFEARLVMSEVVESPSIFLKGMEGSMMPVPVAHGEGRAEFSGKQQQNALMCLRFVDSYGKFTENYPMNPNGSPDGLTGLTTKDGRVTIMMPHPERVFRSWQFSWHPDEWGDDSPWATMFQNARKWVG